MIDSFDVCAVAIVAEISRLRTHWSNEAATCGFNGAVAAISLDLLACTVLSVFGSSVAVNLGELISIR